MGRRGGRRRAFIFHIRLRRLLAALLMLAVGMGLCSLLARGARWLWQQRKTRETAPEVTVQEEQHASMWQTLLEGRGVGLLRSTLPDVETVGRLLEPEREASGWTARLLLAEMPMVRQHQAELLHLAEGTENQREVFFWKKEAPPEEDQEVLPGETETAPQPMEEGRKPVQRRTIAFDSGKYGGGGITLNDYSGYGPDPSVLLGEDIPFTFQEGQPQVLLVHTHTTESYLPDDSGSYPEDISFRSQDASRNMVAVGNAVAQELEAAGVGVIHDTTVHDYPSYNGSYSNAKATIQKQMQAHPTISVVVDIHRDAMIAQDGTVYKTVVEQDGTEYAQVMLVMGCDAGGLTHDGWKGNLTTAVHLQKALLDLVPGIARPITMRKERFNQQLTPNSMLVEVGTCGNTLEEAVRSGHVVGQALARILKG